MSPSALITGGQRGIGLGIAKALKTAGFRLALVAECDPANPEVAAALDQLGAQARYFQHDLRAVGNIGALLDRIEATLGPVCTLISNAGVPARQRGDMLDVAPNNFEAVLDINLKGAFFLAQATARRMLGLRDAPYLSIIFVTSVSAGIASVERAEYCVSKAGAAMMAQLFAARLAGDGIGVFDLRPGIIATDMTAGVRDTFTARIEGGLVPAGRWGLPQDVGQAVVPLARGDMAFATGAVIPVDGGLSIHRF